MMQRQSPSSQPMMMNNPMNPMMMNYPTNYAMMPMMPYPMHPNTNRLLGRMDNILVSGYRIGTKAAKIGAIIAMIISIVMISVGTYLVITYSDTDSSSNIPSADISNLDPKQAFDDFNKRKQQELDDFNKKASQSENSMYRKAGYGLIGMGCLGFLGSLVYLYLYRTLKQEEQNVIG